MQLEILQQWAAAGGRRPTAASAAGRRRPQNTIPLKGPNKEFPGGCWRIVGRGGIVHASTFKDTALVAGFGGLWGCKHLSIVTGGWGVVVCSCPGVNRINFHIDFDGFYILFPPINRKT